MSETARTHIGLSKDEGALKIERDLLAKRTPRQAFSPVAAGAFADRRHYASSRLINPSRIAHFTSAAMSFRPSFFISRLR